MSKYISRKPVVIDAIKFTGDNAQAVIDFINDTSVYLEQDRTTLKLKFPGGISFHVLESSSYLVREPSGYMHPCKKEVFDNVYEIAK